MNKHKSKKILVDVEIANVGENYIALISELKRLNDKLSNGGSDLEVCIDAVVATKRFLDANEIVMVYGLTRPFGILASALRDLSLGYEPSLLQKAEFPPKKGSSKTITLQAVGAAGLDLLMHYGSKRQIAAEFVVQQLRKAGFHKTGNNKIIFAKTVIGWRDEMGGKNTSESQKIYKQIIESIKAELGANAKVSSVQRVIENSINTLINEGITTSK